jgi:iron-sulfur cluster assembly protein
MLEYSFTLTPSAIEQVKKALEKRGTPNAFLRCGVRGGGCSGFTYHLEYYDGEVKDKDLVFEFEGVSVVIDKKSIIYLNGAELEWEKTMMSQGFKFNNPIAKGACGCNESFSV